MSFDPYDQNSWFFPEVSRTQAIEILNREGETGVFLVRNSTSIYGDLVLTVKEENKISHYIINKIEVDGESKFKIGENTFHDLPTLLTFYKHHFLDSTPLIRTAVKKLHYVRAKFDFLGHDTEDLPFKKNEILTVISKQEGQWWTARNENGDAGVIPVPYVEAIDEEEYQREKNCLDTSIISNGGDTSSERKSMVSNGTTSESSPKRPPSIDSSHSSLSLNSQLSAAENKSASGSLTAESSTKKSLPNYNRKLPARALVVQQRIPNAYDKKALRLEKGDIILVTSTNINGQWEGELNGKVGHFPFNYVKFIEEEQQQQQQQQQQQLPSQQPTAQPQES